MKLIRDQKGVALMLVLAALVVLTTMATEFAYNTNVSYHMALNDRDRLKAQYLALSAYRFMLIELKFDKMFQDVVKKQDLGKYLGGQASLPLCQQFPLSTALIRAVFLGGEGAGGEEGAEGAEGAGAAGLPEEFSKMISIQQREGASQFLDFMGDFEGECIDESSRINLNAFASWKADKVIEGKLNDYDQFKEFLIKYFSDPAYEGLFEKADVKPQDAVRNIADWVDTNERINEIGGVMGGPEDSIYERQEARYPLKNNKFTTPGEIYMVEGVVDDWFFPMERNFTIYGDERVDVCNAPSEVVAALIRRYVESKEDPPPLDFNDMEMVDKLLAGVLDGCSMGGTGDQIKKNVSDTLEAAIAEASGASYTPPPQTTTSGTTGGTSGSSSSGTSSADTGFGKYMATERRFFTLKLVGLVGDTAVTITTTLDVAEKDPQKWKVLYWKVQ